MKSKLARKEIAQALLDVITKTDDIESATRQIAAFLISEGLTGQLDPLLRDIERLQAAQTGVLEVETRSVHRLTPDIKRAVESLFEADDIRLHEIIDEDLVGGVRVRAQDTVVDLSVRTQLNQLKHSVKV